MNQTKEEARLRIENANKGSFSDSPSLEYLRELQWWAKVWVKEIDKFLDETIKAQPTIILVKKAVRLKYESGSKLYWNPTFGWVNNPFWTDNPVEIQEMLKEAKANASHDVGSTVKVVHIKCKCTVSDITRQQRYHTINCPLSKPR